MAAIVLFSNDLDKALAALILACGLAAGVAGFVNLACGSNNTLFI